ncbi:unnamed protein product, partial [Adineta ricciae]
AHGNVLFTGDFRLYHGQSKRLTQLHRRRTDNDDNYIFKPIDNLYIDMTFFRPEILHIIPTREVSCEALILCIRAILKQDSNFHFHSKQSARVGYEQIYRTLYENLNMRVHVEQSQYEFFACLSVIQECLITDPTVTRLYACRSAASNYTEPCSLFRTYDMLIRIFLSTMWFTEQVAASELLVEYHEYHSNFNQKKIENVDTIAKQSREAISKKTLNTQIQLKHRRKLFKEQQQWRANDEELDLGLNDEMEETLLQRIHSLNRVLIEQHKTPSSQQSDQVTIITCEEESSLTSDHQPKELIYTKIHRKRTMSETFSDTVDHNFERETYLALKFDSQPSSSSFAIKQEFGRNNKVFPFYQLTGWRPFAKNYRLTVGIVEIVCGITLVLVPSK